MGEWTKMPLRELASIAKGRIATPVSSGHEGAVPYLGAGDLAGSPPQNFVVRSGTVLCRSNDVLMLWDGERSGLVGTGLIGAASSTVARLRA
jgi:type I restriction enzyme, S subunit